MHIEETRGTLKFASRAKCVSNCAQVNEVCVKASKASHSASFIEVSCTLTHGDTLASIMTWQDNYKEREGR